MATKFFTNEGDKTLINKFRGVFEHNQVHLFDALVGFFRASGYFMIHGLLQNVEKIRILVGIDVDSLIADAVKKGLEFNFNAEETSPPDSISNNSKSLQTQCFQGFLFGAYPKSCKNPQIKWSKSRPLYNLSSNCRVYPIIALYIGNNFCNLNAAFSFVVVINCYIIG